MIPYKQDEKGARELEIIWKQCVGSTNDELKKMAAEGASPGTVLIAGRQTGGRGRLGRSFESAPGGAYVSVLLAPESIDFLTCAAAAAVRRALPECGAETEIKWPNDLMLRGKKLCGILTEMVSMGEKRFVVIGAGMNVNQSREDFPEYLREKAISLYMACGRLFDCRMVAEDMGRRLAQLQTAELSGYMDEYISHCSTLGRYVTAADGRCGRAVGIEPDGALRLEDEAGRSLYIRFGEVTVQWNAGE